MKYITNLNLNYNELQNALMHPLPTPPSAPKAGQIYFNLTDKEMYQYDGTKWKKFGSDSIDWSKITNIPKDLVHDSKYVHTDNNYNSTEKNTVAQNKSNIQTINGKIVLTNSTPTVNTLGGINAGTTFDHMPLQDVLNKLLYPWVAPVVSLIAQPSNGGVREIGTTQDITNLQAKVVKKSADITKVEVLQNNSTSLGSKTSGITTGGTFDFPVTAKVSSNGNFNVKVTDKDGKTTTANSGYFTFVYPFYYGATNSAPSDVVIRGLTKKVETKGNKSYAFTSNNQSLVFAYPQSYGDLRIIYDQNNFDVTSTFTKTVVNVTCLDGKSIPYNVYKNSPATLNGFIMKFNF